MEHNLPHGVGSALSHTGLVVRKDRNGCTVCCGDMTYMYCSADITHRPDRSARSARLRDRKRRARSAAASETDAVAAVVVGDTVEIELIAPDRGRVIAVSPRRNQISRRAAGPKAVEQVIAANVDQLVAVFAAAEPAPSWAMLDRYLVIAESAGVPALVGVTKMDLAGDDRLAAVLARYEQIGYPVYRMSGVTGEGLAAFAAGLSGRASLFVGKSGVGKTTLLNALLPGAGQRVESVNARTGKGRHTTTHVEMFPLEGGGGIIDSPGVRELGLWNIADDELAGLFPEMRPHLGGCRFGACTHMHEPGCAVRQAVGAGVVAAERYESYRRMRSGGPAGIKHEADAERRPPDTPAAFRCQHCGWAITAAADGTQHRNHCPQCLWSVHVDVRPGDRSAACRDEMEPIAIWVRRAGEWALVHRCLSCGSVRTNRVAGDDNPAALMSLAARAIAQPPFPLDRLPGRETV